LRRLVRYIARPPISAARVEYNDRKGIVLIHSAKKRGGVRPVVAKYDVLTFIALLVLQVPPVGTHTVRYFGCYSSRSRAARRQAAGYSRDDVPSSGASPKITLRKIRWAELIRQVFEVDPLKCAKCGGQMKVIAFITTSQQSVIDSILDHLGESTGTVKATGPPKWFAKLQAEQHMLLNEHVYGAADGHDESEDFDQRTPDDSDDWEAA